ncbi:acyl-CoA dehydrogenase family protein [Virgibacillus halodenitrificans]|uniref:acyl-CoA dehydrogenase family protein n=1 Tax=Virgibacillus halodenitrificans TaxID=1482 RepID=UPI0024C0B72F|nr:acyl-CoA dehydrogenase family protein [Virgibacillus halodenitrificans]WHX26930.1 acyl-CoA dehydrogenase family protein [Virgibacillus halodenitrificans]
MDFALSEEQEMFRGYLRKYLDDAGQTKLAREYSKGKTNELKATLQGLSELGATGINIPEVYGGLELGTLDLVPVFEEMGRALLPGCYLETMGFAVPLIKKYGTKAQKEKYLPEIAAGTRSITLGVIEPKRDFSPYGIQCFAGKEGDDLVLNGTKTLVPDGDLADTYLLLVRTDEGDGQTGLSFVFVDHQDGVQLQLQKCIDESKHLVELSFNDIKIPNERLLGEEGQGWSILEDGLLYLNAALSSMMVGGMEKVVDMATEYAKIREQFGQPIGRFQAIKHRIVDMKLELETARSLSYYANWALESEEQEREATIYSARSFATNAFIDVASHNIQIHGGIGFSEEIDCHLFLKRARYYESYLGSVNYYNEQIASGLGW